MLCESLCIGTTWSGFVLSTVAYTPIRVIGRVCDVRCTYIAYNIRFSHLAGIGMQADMQLLGL